MSTAAALAPHVGGAEVVQELYVYMHQLGIQGIGLVEATQRAPIVGHIIGTRLACPCAIPCTGTASMRPDMLGQGPCLGDNSFAARGNACKLHDPNEDCNTFCIRALRPSFRCAYQACA